MISGFSDMSLTPKTNYFYLLRQQDTQLIALEMLKPRKTLESEVPLMNNHTFAAQPLPSPSSLVSPRRVVGCRGGSRYAEE